MKKIYLFTLLSLFAGNSPSVFSQVFGHTGATWTFENTIAPLSCYKIFEKWEYIGDTNIMGETCKVISISRKTRTPLSPYFTTGTESKYFLVKGDIVSLFTGSSFRELYNYQRNREFLPQAYKELV